MFHFNSKIPPRMTGSDWRVGGFRELYDDHVRSGRPVDSGKADDDGSSFPAPLIMYILVPSDSCSAVWHEWVALDEIEQLFNTLPGKDAYTLASAPSLC